LTNELDPDFAFTLAHLSDPHLTSLVGVRPIDLANKRVLGYLSWQRRRRRIHCKAVLDALVGDIRAAAPDHLAITGDLTHVGLPAECDRALDWLRELGRSDRVSVVPGNHDRYVADRYDRTVGLWRAYFRGDSGGTDFPFFRRRGRVALIGIDTAVPTAPLLASGRVGDAQRERVAALLTQAGTEGLFRVVLLHHSPLSSGHVRRKRLSDAAEVTRMLLNSGAELVIHGHGHEERIDRMTGAGGPMLVVAVPSASHSVIGRAGWNQYRITGAPGRWRLDIEMRRSTVDGFATKGRETLTWEASISRAAGPRSY
jgi:3',5'-cyclic AMP phosphodiesterase CpdA